MRRFGILLYALLLGTCWQPARLDEGEIRPLEIGEFHRSVTPEMVAALDATPAIAVRAALAIGRTKKPAGAAPLRAHILAHNVSLRAMVVYALGVLGDQGSVAGITSALHDSNSAVRYAAVDALGRLYAAQDASELTSDLADGLLDVGEKDVDATVRGHALAQLDAFHTLPFAASIATRLQNAEQNDPDRDVRWHAAWMLFRGYAKLADLSFLSHRAHDTSELVRIETIRALARRPEARALDIVRFALKDPSWRVQFEAREAVRRLTLQPPTEHLKTMPDGINLPPIDDVTIATPPPSPTDTVTPVPRAPDPSIFSLGRTLLPLSAHDMNGAAPGEHPRVLMHTTKGVVVIKLYPEWAPSTVANFLNLTETGYFNGNRWFRIVPDFVVQTGDPTNTGDGDAGYMIPAEENPIEQRSGVVAMGLNYDAKGAQRDSAGTQFYITLSPQLHLDRAFSVFGVVTSGFEVLAHMDETDHILLAERLCDN